MGRALPRMIVFGEVQVKKDWAPASGKAWILLLLVPCWALLPAPAGAMAADNETEARASARASFLPSRVVRPWRRGVTLEQALEASAADGRPVAAVFSMAGCAPCGGLETETLNREDVRRIAGRYRWVWVDAPRHPSWVEELSIDRLPTLVVLRADGSERQRIEGDAGAELAELLLEGGGESLGGNGNGGSAYPGVSLTRASGYRGRVSCGESAGYGPLNYRSQSPLHMFRQALHPHSPSNLAKGEIEAWLRSTLANLWSKSFDGETRIDLETLQSGLGVRYGLSDSVQMGLEVDSRARFGGILDSTIVEFHDAFGIDQGGRDEVGRGEFRWSLDPGGGRRPLILGRGDRGTFSRSMTASVQHNLGCGLGPLPALSYAATVRYKDLRFSGHSPFLGDDIDVGLSVALAKSWKRLLFFGTLGVASYGDERIGDLELRPGQWSLSIGVEWQWRRRSSLLVQYLTTSSPVEGLGALSRASNELVVGAKTEVKDGWVVEIAIVENLAVSPNSPDFGLHFGLATRF